MVRRHHWLRVLSFKFRVLNFYLVPIRDLFKALLSVQFINVDFLRWARPHKGLRCGVLYVRRSRKPAENAAQRKKDYLWMDTI
jgi:hypothetical protein